MSIFSKSPNLFSGADGLLGAEDDSVFGAEEIDVSFAGDEDGADLLLQHYGEDLEDMDFSEAFGATEEVESAVRKDTPTEPLQGRVAMARRVRREEAPGLLQAGYVKGVQDVLAHFGLAEPALQARMGLLWGEAAMGNAVALPENFGVLPSGKKGPLFDPNSAIEADAAELPPVYVADTVGARCCLSSGRAGDVSAPFALEDRFGDAALAGFVGSQRRAGPRRAAERALSSASASVASTSGGQGAAFVEDVEATPHLFSDGSILDPVYGKLRVTPCPSCSVCSAEDVQAGHAKDCALCDGHGAVLIPQEDAQMWSGIRYGFLVPLVLGVGAEVVDGLLGSSSSEPRRVKRRRPTFSWTTPDPQGSEEDVARAIVPERLLPSTST